MFGVLQGEIDMQVEILKRPDGVGLLRCTRKDGSVTWQKQTAHGAFFALHDLTHFAVETVLGCEFGFFGLIEAGWDLDDAAGNGDRRTAPEESGDVERIVGLFDSERASGTVWTVEEFNSFAPKTLTVEQIHKIRSLRAKLFKQWREVTPGQSLVLGFQAGTVK